MTGIAASLESPAGLDLHEGISDAAGAAGSGCSRWPKAMRLLASSGVLVPGRCRATNKCAYCRRLAAVETSELLALDALESGRAPTIYVVLTTPSTELDAAHFYEARRQFWRAVEREFPRAEFACVLEVTTGRADTSRGAQRLHWNYVLKGIPSSAAGRRKLRRIIREVWCQRHEHGPMRSFRMGDGTANVESQYLGAIAEVGGLMRYLALHFLKESQTPPSGWRGQRFTFSKHRVHRCSSGRKRRHELGRLTACDHAGGCGRDGAVTRPGYFGEATYGPRARARAALAFKRELHRATEAGYSGVEAELVAELAHVRARGLRWECVIVSDRTERVDQTEVAVVSKQTGELRGTVRLHELEPKGERRRPLAGGEVTVFRRPRGRDNAVDIEVERARSAVRELELGAGLPRPERQSRRDREALRDGALLVKVRRRPSWA